METLLLSSSLTTHPASAAWGVKTSIRPPGTGVGTAVGSKNVKALAASAGVAETAATMTVAVAEGVMDGVGAGGISKRV